MGIGISILVEQYLKILFTNSVYKLRCDDTFPGSTMARNNKNIIGGKYNTTHDHYNRHFLPNEVGTILTDFFFVCI